MTKLMISVEFFQNSRYMCMCVHVCITHICVYECLILFINQKMYFLVDSYEEVEGLKEDLLWAIFSCILHSLSL